MRHGHERHPFFENLVIGLALLLFGIVVFYGAKRFWPSRAGARPIGADRQDAASKPASTRHDLDVGPTERGVAAAPPVDVTRLAREKRRSVPSPR